MSKQTKAKITEPARENLPKVRINFDVEPEFRNKIKSHFAIQGKSIGDGCRDLLAKELLQAEKDA